MTVQITGDKALDRFFRDLPGKLQRGAIRKGVRAAGSALIRETRQNIGRMLKPQRLTRYTSQGKKTSLKKSMGQRAWSRPRAGLISTVVGPRWPEGAHGHLVEFGHQVVSHGQPTGHRARPIPFQRNAMRSARTKILAAQRAKLREALLKMRAR